MDQGLNKLNITLNQARDAMTQTMKGDIHELLNIAKSEKEKGNIDLAIMELKKANKKLEDLVKTQPKTRKTTRNYTSGYTPDIVYLNQYGNILYDIEEYQEALNKYKEVDEIELRPNIQKAQGDSFRNLNNYEEAHAKYQLALKLYKDDTSLSLEDEAAVYNSIGLTYVAQGDHENALKEFKKAIKFSKKFPNPLYYCNKGSILYIRGEKNRGTVCFIKAVELYEEGKIEGLTIQNLNFIKEILKPFIWLESEKKGKLLEVVRENELAKIIQENNETDKEIPYLLLKLALSQEKKISSLERKVDIYEKLHKKLEKRITILESSYQIISEEVKAIESVSKERFESLTSSSKKTYNMFNEDLRVLKTEVTGIKEWKIYISDTLTEANLFLEVETKKEFESIKKMHDVYIYATFFYRALSDSLLAYRLISTGLVKGENHDYTGVVGKRSKILVITSKILMILGVADVSNVLSTAVGIIDIVKGFYEQYSKVKLDRISKKIADIIPSSFLEKDFNLAIARSAIRIAKSKEENLEKLKTKDPTTKIRKARKWFSNAIEMIIANITKINSVPENKVRKMALKDVTLFIIYSFVQSDTNLCTEDVDGLSQIIEELFKANKELFVELYEKTNSK